MNNQFSNLTYDDYLEHYGVKGMKWGVRKSDRPDGVSRRTNREARKDAKEAARAKMFYGEGAGTRRKLINNSVAAKSKRDPSYKKAYDFHAEKQDMARHAEKARSERRRKDTIKSTKKTARGVKNLAMGTGASVSTAALVAYYAYNDPTINRAVRKAGARVMSEAKNVRNRRAVNQFLKGAGFK